jgi:ZIP family zinc transporter
MRRLLWLIVPVALLAALLAALLVWRPLDRLASGAPPVEEVAVERVRLSPRLIQLGVRADGSEPVRIAQVQVDGAYRTFTQSPPGPIGRLDTATLAIEYPWVDGETHHLTILTSTGVTFDKTIDVAQETPTLERTTALTLALVGLLLGVAPVAAGMLAYPALRSVGETGMQFLLALTVGLLTFLLIDTLREGLEFAAGAVERLRTQTLVWVAMLVSAALLIAVGRRGGRAPQGVALAFFIALGIGLHNFGEGLAVGASLAAGAAALAAFLVIGFTIHNVTEGVGIAVPLVDARPPIAVFVGLTALAGLPAVLGVWLGALAVEPLWLSLAFGVAAGALLQVIIEVGALTFRRGGRLAMGPASLGGVAAGLCIMYATAILV